MPVRAATLPGFVEIVDDKTLLMADRRGNNRIDSLRNILRNPQVALLFLVPGIGETLRVNGTCRDFRRSRAACALRRQRQGPAHRCWSSTSRACSSSARAP